MDDFGELMVRITSLTGLTGRDAAQVAFELEDEPLPQEIIDKAIELGFEVERKHGGTKTGAPPEMSTDPAEVLGELYMVMPRVLCEKMPQLGKAPDEIQRHEQFAEMVDEMPDEMRAMLVKIDVFDAKATFWVRDEANDVDRPIGPIDVSCYGTEKALEQAFISLMQRMNKVLTADFN